MSEQQPVYSNNKLISAAQHAGHFLHEAATDVTEFVPKFITVADDVKDQAPGVVTDFKTLVGDVAGIKGVIGAIALAFASGCTNVSADVGVLAAIEAEGAAFVKLGHDFQTLYTTLSTDINTDVAAA